MERRKELKELYKNMKPEMGIFIIKSTLNNKCYLEETQNLKGAINGAKFRLNAGNHVNKELQKDWAEHGEENFTIEVLENLEYDKDEAKIDYTEDLAILKMIWEEKLSKQGVGFYKK